MQPGSSVTFVARRYAISPSRPFTWKRRMLEGGREAVAADEDVVGTSKVRELERVHTPCAPAKRLRPSCEVVVAPRCRC